MVEFCVLICITCVSCRAVSNSSPVHDFEPLFWTGQLLDTLWLKARAIFDGSIFNADPRAPGHNVMFNVVWLYKSYL